eukprot:14971668-Ditylum_brightwellii.AAC.1
MNLYKSFWRILLMNLSTLSAVAKEEFYMKISKIKYKLPQQDGHQEELGNLLQCCASCRIFGVTVD